MELVKLSKIVNVEIQKILFLKIQILTEIDKWLQKDVALKYVIPPNNLSTILKNRKSTLIYIIINDFLF